MLQGFTTDSQKFDNEANNDKSLEIICVSLFSKPEIEKAEFQI